MPTATARINNQKQKKYSDMKRYRLIEYAYLATLVLGVTACSQDELADGSPVNGTPVTFTASGIAAQQSATTRATTDGTWEEALTVAIKIGNEVKEYAATPNAADAKTATLAAAEGVTPFTWNSASETKTVEAWYPYTADKPAQVEVEADQSIRANYLLSDKMSASGNVTFGNTALEFSHLAAKVTININMSVESSTASVSDLKLCNLAGVKEGTQVKPFQPDGNMATFEVLLPEQTIAAGTQFLTFAANSLPYAWNASTDYKLTAGSHTVFTFRLDNKDIIFEGCTLAEWKPAGDDIEAEPTPGQLYAIDDDGTYLVSSAAGLMAWAEMARKDPTISCRLTGVFTLPSTYKWTPIGDGEKPFSGTFNGGGYHIRNLKVNSTVTDSKGRQVAGMFGEVTGTVKSVQLYGSGTGIEVESDQPGLAAGMVAGTLTGGTISNCTSYPYDYIVAKAPSDVYVGGVVGYNDNGFVAGNEFVFSTRLRGIATANDGTAYVGGVAGANVGKDAVVIGSLSAAITESYVDSPASTTNYAGGILGYAAGGSTCTGNAVWCNGSQVSSHGGGALGYAADTDIAVNNCYWYYSSGSSAVGAYATGSSGDYSGISSNARVSSYYDMAWLNYAYLLQGVVDNWNAANDRKCNAYFNAQPISSGSTEYYPILVKLH